MYLFIGGIELFITEHSNYTIHLIKTALAFVLNSFHFVR